MIQAFSRTNRILNDTKPYGNILDFRKQQTEVDNAIALFSGEDTGRAKEIWLVDTADKVIQKYETAVSNMSKWMQNKNLETTPEDVYNIKGDAARAEFINHFKEVQKLKTQLDQYTEMDENQQDEIETLLPEDMLRSFKSSYLEMAKQLKTIQQKKDGDVPKNIQEVDFEFVLFASALIDYDYIMSLISKYTQTKPTKKKMTRDQLISLISSTSNLMNDRDEIIEYINTLEFSKGLSEKEIHDGIIKFKSEKSAKELTAIAKKNSLEINSLKEFIENILNRMIFDGEKLSELFISLDISWKERINKEIALMEDLTPFLKKQSLGKEISGLNAYE